MRGNLFAKSIATSNYLFASFCILVGFLVLLLSFFEMLAGDSASVRVHDTMDGLISHYVLAADQGVFSGPNEQVSLLPTGVCRSSINTGVDFWLLLFAFLPAYWAFVAGKAVMSFTAFFGVLLCALAVRQTDDYRLITRPSWCWCVLLATIFGLVPHFGLTNSSAGIPLVFGCYLFLRKRVFRIGCCFLLLFYGWSSSLLLSGLFLIPLLGVLGFVFWCVSSSRIFDEMKILLVACGCLTLGFCVSHIHAIAGVLSGSNFVSHRTVWVMTEWRLADALHAFKNALFHGNGHAVSLHEFLVLPIGIFCLLLRFRFSKIVWFFGGYILIAAVISGFVGVGLIKDFQEWTWRVLPVLISRVVFISPGFWYMLGAVLGMNVLDSSINNKFIIVVVVLFLGLFIGVRYWVGYENRLDKKPWCEFFNASAFEEVVKVVGSARIACIGFHPSVAHMAGVKTIGFYSSNYPVSYKKKMRELIYMNLDGSYGWRFDDWGSRCYPIVRGYGEDEDCRQTGYDFSAVGQLELDYLVSNSCLEKSAHYNMVAAVVSDYDDLWIYRIVKDSRR